MKEDRRTANIDRETLKFIFERVGAPFPSSLVLFAYKMVTASREEGKAFR
jgi:hypothetical protein